MEYLQLFLRIFSFQYVSDVVECYNLTERVLEFETGNLWTWQWLLGINVARFRCGDSRSEISWKRHACLK